MHQDFKRRLTAGEPLQGTMVTIAAPEVSEMIADLGFDWLFIDGEHGPLGLREIQAILQTVGIVYLAWSEHLMIHLSI